MEEGKKRSVFDVLKWPTKKQASTPIDPPAVVEAPAELRPKRGRPKANQDKEAEIRMKRDEVMSRLSATGSQKNPIDVDKDVPPKKEFQQRENYDSGPGKERMDAALEAMKRAKGANRNQLARDFSWSTVLFCSVGDILRVPDEEMLRRKRDEEAAAKARKKTKRNALGELVSAAKVLNDPTRIEQGKALMANKAILEQEAIEKRQEKRRKTLTEFPLIEKYHELGYSDQNPFSDFWKDKMLTVPQLEQLVQGLKLDLEAKAEARLLGQKKIKRDDLAAFLIKKLSV